VAELEVSLCVLDYSLGGVGAALMGILGSVEVEATVQQVGAESLPPEAVHHFYTLSAAQVELPQMLELQMSQAGAVEAVRLRGELAHIPAAAAVEVSSVAQEQPVAQDSLVQVERAVRSMQQEAAAVVVAQELRQSVLMEAQVQQESVERVEQVEMAVAAEAAAE